MVTELAANEAIVASNGSQGGNVTRHKIVDEDLMKKLQILRLGDKGGGWQGFQRSLNERRVNDIIRCADRGELFSSIMVGDVNGQLVLIDGQHRLEARRQSDFELWAEIKKMSMRQCIIQFISMNSKAVKVSLAHRLKVDVSGYATRCRTFADKYNLTPSVINGMLSGFQKNSGVKPEKLTRETWDTLDEILKLWSNDKKWQDLKLAYTKPGMLKLIAYLYSKGCGESYLKKMKELDFNPGSKIDRYTFQNWGSLQLLRQEIAKQIGPIREAE